MIGVRTSSRLHFGLLSLPAEDSGDVSYRMWGGAGLMVAQPGVDLEAEPAPHWPPMAHSPIRILDLIQTFRQTLLLHTSEEIRSRDQQRLSLNLHNAPPTHQGLGTGTQLALAVARVLAEHYQLTDKGAPTLAARVRRGTRSALGIHGFDQGGFLVDGGKSRPDHIAPLVARAEFPETWRVLLMLFPDEAGVHGENEIMAFQSLQHTWADRDTNVLCRLVLLGMLPALVEKDLQAFGEALFEFNRRVGEAFLPVQKGIYAHRRAADIVAYLRGQGVAGVGQSSWGPALFAVVADEGQAIQIAGCLRERFRFRVEDLIITRAANHGAQIVV